MNACFIGGAFAFFADAANLQRMLRSVTASLDYHTKHYSPYPHKHLRLVEYPSSGRGMGERGIVVTIEPSDDMITMASGYLQRANLFGRVQIARGNALDVMPDLTETYDLIFIDAVKEEYAQYLDLGLPRLRTGGVVIVDNLLWGGRVAQPAQASDESSTVALREFNHYFINHPQLRSEILSIGDGLGYAVKTS